MSNRNEDELVELGMYCEQLLADQGFNKLVEACSDEFGRNILEAENADKREEIVAIYQGLKAFLSLATQFVMVKDQIAAKQNQKQDDE